MKILFVIGNMGNGGAQRVASVICNKLAERGHDVSLLLFNRLNEEYFLSNKIEIIALAQDYQSYSSMSFVSVISRMRKIIKRIAPDVAIGFTTGGYVLYLSSLGMDFPKIASARIAPHVIFRKKGLRAYINRKWFRCADAVVLQTEGQITEMPLKLSERSVVIPNPIDFNDIPQFDYGFAFCCRKIIMAGRLDAQKNYPMAIDAIEAVLRRHPEVQLTIYGVGDLCDELEAMIRSRKLQDHIFLAGWTDDVRQKFLESDLYLLTSDFEGMPNALMEAMACGLPCISTDCRTGPSELIEDGVSGILVPVGDTKGLAEAICYMIEMDAEERRKLGRTARSTISEKYNAEKIVSSWEKLMKEISSRC